MLFCILLLSTTPTFSAFSAMLILGLSCRLLSQERLDTRQIPPDRAKPVRRVELTHGLLNAHPEQLIGEVALLGPKLVDPEVAQFRGLHEIFSSAKRVANFVE